MQVSIIVIGKELLLGQVIDTNSSDIAHRLDPLGWKVGDIQIVDDDAFQITRAIDRAFESSDVVITTGGLGPTKDDITKQTLCNYFGGELIFDDSVLDTVKQVISARGLELNDLTAKQAMVPSSCRVIQNEVGTAPIMWFERDGKVLVTMPGVPFETREMLDRQVIPQLVKRFPSKMNYEHRTVMVVGYSESLLAMRIEEWEKSLPPYLHLAYLPKPGLVRLRIDGAYVDKPLLISEINHYHAMLCSLLGENVLCDADIPVEEILLQELEAHGLTISTAESCTGGNIAHLLTSVPGSSKVFNGGVVAYSNEVKERVLGVNAETLTRHGAVSIPVVEEMVTGACKALGSDCAIATSGIAGPSGATDGKPVGTVCIAIKTPAEIFSFTHHFPGDRQRIIIRASMTAMIAAIEKIKALPRHNEQNAQ